MTDESIFNTALNISDSGRRRAYLDQACVGDSGRRARVERLLTAHRSAGSFLEPAAPDYATTRASDSNAEDDIVADVLARLAPSDRQGALGRIGHYDALEVLGRGGFGVVFRAFDDVLQRVVAIKVLAPAMAATSPARKRFIREAQASAQIRHENVVQVYAVEEHPLPHIVMEFIPGETLQERLDRTGPLASAAEVVRFGKEIAEGLAAAHEKGLIHRDVKPGNVLIESGPHERAKLTDFGLARAADDASLTQSGAVAGTPLFMSPEQAKGAQLDCRTDLFSLGSVLYTLCTGRPPFRAPSGMAVLRRVVEEQPRPIREIIPEVPVWLCDIIEKLHAKNPADRFQTAREVADLLADCLSQLNTDSVLKDLSRIPRPRAQKRWPWAVAALIAVAAIAVAGYALRPAATPDRAELPAPVPPVVPPVAPPGNAVAPPPRAVAEPSLPSVPFDGAKAQAEWARYLNTPVEFADKTVGMEFRVIPPGEFLMGSSAEHVDPRIKEVEENMPTGYTIVARSMRSEKPQRQVRISRPFAIGKYEVTVKQFAEFVRDQKHVTTAEKDGGFGFEKAKVKDKDKDRDKLTGVRDKKYDWQNVGYVQTPACPVWNVSYEDATAFCKWLSQKEGRTYRLPTEAEWEWACRGGTADRHFWANLTPDDIDAYANVSRAVSRAPQEVGKLRPNAFGLHDVCGNVWEWCADWYGEAHYADTAGRGPLTDPKGPNGPDGKGGHRVQRGGASTGGRFAVASAGRSHTEQSLCGFRVLLELDPK